MTMVIIITVLFLRYTLKRRVSGRRLEASCRQGDVEVKRSNEKYCDFILRATDFMQLKSDKSQYIHLCGNFLKKIAYCIC